MIAHKCRFSLSDDTPDDTTLVVFRARLGEERFRRLFDRIVKQAMELGLLTERRKIIDATVIRADVALKNRAELLRQGRKRVIREVAARCPERAAALERFSGSKDKEGLSREEIAIREEELTEEMLDALSDVDDDKVRFWAEELRKVKDGEASPYRDCKPATTRCLQASSSARSIPFGTYHCCSLKGLSSIPWRKRSVSYPPSWGTLFS